MKHFLLSVVMLLLSHVCNSQTFAQVKNFYFGQAGSIPRQFSDLGNNKFVFFIEYGQMAVSDGTTAGTQILNNRDTLLVIEPLTDLMHYYPVNGKLCVHANDGMGTNAGIAITDGTPAGTQMLKVTDPTTWSATIQSTAIANGKFYFLSGNLPATLWQSDGTAAGTLPIKTMEVWMYGHHVTGYNNNIFFTGYDEDYGYEPWISDGTLNGTQMLEDVYTGDSDVRPHAYYVANGKLWFPGHHYSQSQLIVSDGTANGTEPLLSATGGFIYQPFNIYGSNGKTYFVAADSFNNVDTGNKMWVTDGTNAGTHVLKNINPTGNVQTSANFDAYFPGYATLGTKTIFAADDGVNGSELWITDGTTAGTTLLKNINPNGGSYPNLFTFYNGRVYFKAADDTVKFQLWTTDGTTAGTVKVANINSTSQNPFGATRQIFSFNGNLYFNANFDSTGNELWSFAAPVTDINEPIPPAGFSIYPNPANTVLFINAENNDASTITIVDINGQKVATQTYTRQLDISWLKPGIYFIELKNEQAATRQRFVKL